MTRSNPQNDCLHKWCRVIRDHINQERVIVTEETVKELVLLKMGNTRQIMGEKVAMRSSKYKMLEAELTPEERKAGFISMSELLSMMEVWAAMDLGLQLVRGEA